MNTRSRQYRRFACELTDVQIQRIKELASNTPVPGLNRSMFTTELTRRMIDHALACPLFLLDLSENRKVQQSEGGTE